MNTTKSNPIIIRNLAMQDYATIWQAMREFTDQRNDQTADEIWLLEHNPVFTLGQNGKTEHILNAGNIPVIHVDRGGQVTYHGPGQLVAYVLIDLRRQQLSVRNLVSGLEKAVIQFLADYQIAAQARCDAPGVYIDQAKICSLGLRVRRGCSFHGLAFNIAMDLSPFSRINPCGFTNLAMTQLADFGVNTTPTEIAPILARHLCQQLGYNECSIQRGIG